MIKQMILELHIGGGGVLKKELFYDGDSLNEIAAQIQKDENELLEYMMSRDDNGIKSFCFCGFMFQKEGIIAAQLYEPEFWEN